MKQWAQRNPAGARIILRLVLRLAIALAIVIPLGALGQQWGISPNIAAIIAVIVALWLGARAAAWVADQWELPPDEQHDKAKR